jgi:outer membrane usher protein
MLVPCVVLSCCAGAHAQVEPWVESIVAVELNGQPVSEGTLVQVRSGQLCVQATDLAAWRLVLPALEPEHINGMACHRLETLALKSAQFDPARLSVKIDALPQAFAASQFVAPAAVTPAPTASDPGGFLNYDVFAQHDPSGNSRYGLFELGAFGAWGNLVNSSLARSTPVDRGTVRLDTTWTTDFPNQMTSLHLGDAVTQAGTWGQAVRFAGVQYGRNFATQPGFVTIPLQSASGVAVLPSTVDIYINNALSAQRQVPPGPFAIRDLPVVTGSGQITMVVRDLLGREQVVTQAFTSSLQLLREGLTDYSVEAGAVRRDYGVRSADYGAALVSATVRHGLTDAFTVEAHGEHGRGANDERLNNGGVSGAWLIEPWGTASAQLAASRQGGQPGQQSGHLTGIGFDHASDAVSASMQWQRQTQAFARIGDEGQIAPTRDMINASVNRGFGRWGTLGAAYVRRDYYGAPQTRVASLSASASLNAWGYVVVSLLRSQTAASGTAPGSSGRTQINAVWSIPLAAKGWQGTHASIARQPSPDGRNEWVAAIQRNPPPDTGWSWLAQASDLGNGRAQAAYQSGMGIAQVDAEHYAGSTSTRAGVQGGIGSVGGTVFLSRPIHDSFALVRLPDLPGVRVNANNLDAGVTNTRGELLLPALRPYERNTVGIEQLDLGIATEIDSLSIDVVPYARSGLVVRFPVRRVHAATLRLVLPDGSFVPAGAAVEMVGALRDKEVRGGKPRSFPVGSDGEVYLSNLTGHHQIEAHWAAQRCRAEVEYLAGSDPLPDLGTVRCTLVDQRSAP